MYLLVTCQPKNVRQRSDSWYLYNYRENSLRYNKSTLYWLLVIFRDSVIAWHVTKKIKHSTDYCSVLEEWIQTVLSKIEFNIT